MSRKPAGAQPTGSLAGTAARAGEVTGTGPRPVPPGDGHPAAGRQPWRAAFFALAALAIVAGVAWALLDSRFFVVRSIEVTGTHLVSPAQVRAAAGIPTGLPLVRVDEAAAARRIENIRQVASARVAVQWPDRVTISVTERAPVLAVPSTGGYQLIDADGVAVESAARVPGGMPVLRGTGGQPVSGLRGSAAVHAAALVVRELPRSLARSVASVLAPSATGVSFTLRSGITVMWGGTGRPAAKARELTLLMRTHARHYDVSAPGTAVTGG